MKLSREFAHSAFERPALRNPSATTMACGDARAACGALDAGANRPAHHLPALCIGPDARPAVALTDVACCPSHDPQQAPITERQGRTQEAAAAVREYIVSSSPIETTLAQSRPELPGVEEFGTRNISGVGMSLRELFDGPSIEKRLEAICANVGEAAMDNA